MKWFDISQPLMNGIAVWPGDTPFSYEVSCTKEQSGSVNIGKLTLSTHTGTHIDAPFHFDERGRKVVDLDIDIYIGHARVIDVSSFESIGAKELAAYDLEGVSRLLLRTASTSNPLAFPERITHLRAEIAVFLHEKGLRLLGADVPSVDPLDSKDLEVAVLIPGARAPRLVTEEMVKTMQPGSVIVDVATDQGGSIETIDRITTHSEPTYEKHGLSTMQ